MEVHNWRVFTVSQPIQINMYICKSYRTFICTWILDYCKYCKHKGPLLHVCIGQELGAAHFINQERAQETSSHIHTLILSKEMRNLKKEKSWRLLGRTKTKGNKANKIPETCKCNTQIERMETPVHNTSSTKKKGNNNKPTDEEWQTQKRSLQASST